MEGARFWCGVSSLGVQHASAAEVAYLCGSSLVLLNVHTGQQRVLGSSTCIHSFASSVKGGVLAVALKGYQPAIHVYSTHNLQHQASLTAGASFGYTAVALSHDGELLAACADRPDLELTVWQWRKGLKLASIKLQAPVSQISFHPADAACLLTTSAATGDDTAQAPGSSYDPSADSSAAVLLWQLHRCWQRHELQSTPLQLPEPCQPTCHAWAPEGVYVGCSDGSVVCISPETGAVISMSEAVAATSGHAESSGAADSGDTALAASSTSGVATSISSIAVNKHWVVAASCTWPHLCFFQRSSVSGNQAQPSSLLRVGSIQASSVGCAGLTFGGQQHTDLLVSTMDGSLLLVSPSSSFDPLQPDPAGLQVDPLADWHVGPITGIAPAPTGAHLISCGVDGSIRVWAAAAGGQLVSKRDVGGQLTCCTSSGGAEGALLAAGSRAGVLRLVNMSDLSSLPVVHHTRLFRAPVTHVGFSCCGTYLAVAAAETGRVALLKLGAAGQQAELLGYVKVEGRVLSLCWLPQINHQHPQLLLTLSGGSVLQLTPPLRPAQANAAQLLAVSAGSSDSASHGLNMFGLSHADVQAAVFSAPAALQALAVLPQDQSSSAARGRVSGIAAVSGTELLGAGSDGQLYWLQLPSASAASAAHPQAGAQQLVVLSKAALPWPATALAVSPASSEVLLAAHNGAVILLPSSPAAAAAALTAAGTGAVSQPRSGVADGTAPVILAWSGDASWAAMGGADGSLVVCPQGTHNGAGAAAALPSPTAILADCDVLDDSSAPTAPEAAAAQAEQEASAAAGSVRAATLQQLQDLKSRLEQVLEANAAAPADQQLSDAELVLNSQLLQQLRGEVAAEEAALLSEAPRKSLEQEVQAKRLKALCWDAFEVKRAACTGLKSGDTQVWNFQLPVQDDSAWAQVAEQRREALLAANKHILDQDFTRSAASSMAAGALPPAGPASTPGAADSSSGGVRSSDGGASATLSTAASTAAVGDGISQQTLELLALLARVKGCADARKCSPADLLLPELAVTSPEAKLMQAEIYKRMAWELKMQFNEEFASLVKQKHTDADRLADLNTRMDQLIRERVKIHSVLNPAASAVAAAATDAAAGDPDAVTSAPAAGSAAKSAGAGQAGSGASTAREGAGGLEVLSAAQLAAELAAGRLVPHWSPEESLEDMLLKLQPGEVKARKYLTPAERAKADAEEAAAEAARRAAAADSSRTRALQQMMGGRLERSVDTVSELVTSRPAWMVSGDPASFSEEQLKEYKEDMAKEAAAIEDRLKRKGIMETELRTLKAAADDVASKFDAAVAALAAKRLDVLAEVTALETRVLQLQADEEVASVTAGPEAQAAAEAKLQQAQEALLAVEQELAVTQHLHDQQQEALAALHAEEKAADRSFKRDFSSVDPLVLPHLTSLYKSRLVPLGALAAGHHAAAAAAAGQGSSTGRLGSASRGSIGPSPRMRGLGAAGSPRASIKAGAGADPSSPKQGHGGAVQSPGLHSAELAFAPLQLTPAGHAASAASAVPAGASGSGAHGHSSTGAANHYDLNGPLGPPEMQVVQLYEDQLPEGLDEVLWLRFVELHSARARLDLAVRDQTAQVLCLRRQLQLLHQRQAQLSEAVAAAGAALESLRQQQHQALHDVEVQLRLKQGQVEVWPQGLAAIAPEALLVERQEVKALNSIILNKGEAKLEMLRKMKEFKRGIHQLGWENKKCEMEAEDVTSLTQQLQLLHVTKEFQQQVKASSTAGNSSSSGGRVAGAAAATEAPAARGAAAAAGSSAAANKEVTSLENLLKVRETLHANAVGQKKRQMRSLEAQLAAKRNENATLALHLAGLERLLDDAARLRASTAADDAMSAADRKARSLAMQAKLRDIAEAQAAEIEVAERELQAWQQRCFPCLPALAGDSDDQQAGADQAPAGSSSRPGAGSGSCSLPDIKGAQGSSIGRAGDVALGRPGGFAPHGARAGGQGALPGTGSGAGLFGGRKGAKAYIGPDGKPGLLKRG